MKQHTANTVSTLISYTFGQYILRHVVARNILRHVLCVGRSHHTIAHLFGQAWAVHGGSRGDTHRLYLS